MLATIYVEFRDACREKGHDAEEVLEEWAIQQDALDSAQNGAGAVNVKWDDADQLALRLLSED